MKGGEERKGEGEGGEEREGRRRGKGEVKQDYTVYQ